MKHLKLFFACLLMAVLSIGQVWATEVTYSFTPDATSTGSSATSYQASLSFTYEGVSWTMAQINPSTLQTKTNQTNPTAEFNFHNTSAFPGRITQVVVKYKALTIATGKQSEFMFLGGTSAVTATTGGTSGTWNSTDKTFTWTPAANTNYTYFAYYMNGKTATGSNFLAEANAIVVTYDDGQGGGSDPVAVTGVTLDQSEAEIAVGGTVTLTPTVAPSNATTKTVTWESDDEDVATVDNGVVTGVAEGTATITVKTTDGNKTATCAVTVTAAPAAATYEKVTAAPSDWSGEYLLVYESGTTAHVWTGADAANCYATATISANAITKPNGAATLTIAAVTGGYSLLISGDNNDGKYITDNANNAALKFADAAYAATISYETDWTKIMFSQRCIRFNNGTSSGMRFRYYAATGQQPVQLYKKAGAPAAVAKPTISGTDNFLTSTEVTIECTTDGAAIYYTTTESAKTTPATSGDWMAYNGASKPSFSSTTTVWAAAKLGDDWSEVAEKTFTKATILTTAAELVSFATTTDQQVYVNLANWKVTFVSGDYVYLVDASNEGVVLKQASHGYTAGDVLSDVAYQVTAKKSSGRVQLSGFTSENISATSGTVEPSDVTDYSTITAANQSALVTLKEATYDATNGTFSDGVNEIYYYDQFNANPTLIDGKNYDVTGIVIYYKTNTAEKVEIAPRTSGDVVPNEVIVIPTAANLAALKAAERGTYILTLTNAVVTYVNGNNAFIEDATGGALIYFASHGYSAGDCLNGDYQVITTDYQGKFEITSMEPQAGAAKTTAEIPLTTVSIATLNASFSSYESRRVKIVGANVTDAISGSDRNGAINDGAALAVYAAAGASTITLTADDNVDIIGYPGFHNTDQQLTVWAQTDITVNVKEDPELAYNPAVVNVLLSDLASFTPAVLEYATGFDGVAAITYESSDPSIATVETDGTVTLVATAEGSTTITATFSGNATYKADNASYTINVSAAPIAPVYTMSFDMTRASYDAAADAEVVWNSNVVTMTVAKNTSSTKANNYIGGGYNGDTHCADSRFYPGSIITFAPASGVTITKVEWTATSNSYASNLVSATWTNASATAEGTIVTIVPSASGDFSAEIAASKQARATVVTVYYEAESEKSKLAASISIDNINTAVGEDDIVLLNIAATSNPNKNAISYAITSGTAVSLVGEGKAAAFHAVEEGTATITATIPNDLGNYTGATTTFDIVVAAAPATLVSIAISGEATALEYTEGQDFNPAGLVVTGTYSDASTAPISDGITWAFDPSPLTVGTTSVSVTATVGEISSAAVVVNGLTVSAAPVPTSGNIVILAEYNSKFYAMTNSLTSGALAGVEVEKDGSKIVVSSAEDKAAIQWTATVDGDNTTLKDGENNYIKGSSGASLSLEADPYNWNWDGEKSCYISSAYTNRGLFFSNSGNVFKGYALSNITSDGYAATEVIEIDPEDIVISSKVDPALAYTPASDEITAGDAWSAPVLGYVEGFDGLAAITYESSNEAVATVTDAGVIALAGGTGTATITATFAGNASYLAGSATYTVKVNEPAEDCDGTDDFITATNTSASSYNVARTTTNGWSSVNSALTTINSEARWLTMLGKTSQVGVITSPTLNDGIASLKIRYANTFNETNGVSFRVDIKQGEDIVKTYTITKENSEVEKGTVYTETIENINVAGDFQIIFTNLCPSAADSNKDRVSIGKLCWKGYVAPEPPTKDLIRDGLSNGKWGTLCPTQNVENVEGAVFYLLSYLEEKDGLPYNVVFDEITGPNLQAGKPYFFIANAEEIRGNKTGDVATAAGAGVNGFYGYIGAAPMNLSWRADYDVNYDNTFVIYNNSVFRINGYTQLKSERCYININATEPSRTAVPKAYGRRRITMSVAGTNVATGFENLNASEKPVKLMIDGNIYILRGEKLYDATGRLVK